MTLEVYIHSKNGRVIEIPDYPADPSVDNNTRLSVDERMALLKQAADKFTKSVGPDFKPLSDYALSREGLYADHL